MTNNRTASTVTLPRREAAMALALLGMIAALGSDPVRANDADNAWIAQIDLGVDVRGILKTPDAVRALLVSLEAKTGRVVLNACQHYIESPDSIIGPHTLTFCSIAVGEVSGSFSLGDRLLAGLD